MPGCSQPNRIDDAFVVVSTAGYATMCRCAPTKTRTLAAPMPRGTCWCRHSGGFRGKYEIDPMDLPPDVLAPDVEQRVAVRRGSGCLLEFPLKRVMAASVELVDGDQQVLKLGSRVTHTKVAARRWWDRTGWCTWRTCRRITACRWKLKAAGIARWRSTCLSHKARCP